MLLLSSHQQYHWHLHLQLLLLPLPLQQSGRGCPRHPWRPVLLAIRPCVLRCEDFHLSHLKHKQEPCQYLQDFPLQPSLLVPRLPLPPSEEEAAGMAKKALAPQKPRKSMLQRASTANKLAKSGGSAIFKLGASSDGFDGLAGGATRPTAETCS